jgi:hypothetical protein
MATRIEVEYDRQFPSSEIQALIARSNVTLSVFQQLGVAYQTLPGLAMAAYQTETDALEADVSALNALVDQIRPLLIAIDAKAGPLDEKNKATLKTLSGLLTTDADRLLLDQITGPTPQPPTPPAPPTP